MCISPNKLADGTLVACRECWQCKSNRVDDWAGRCIAESQTAKASHSMTLTYGGGDHVRATLLTYSDVQKYFKLLRRHGYPCRYFAVGEYGSKKGRAHWHLIVYWLDRVPPHDEKMNFEEEHWPHGWSFWERLGSDAQSTAAAVRYACKYLQKETFESGRQFHLAMSKKPPLGAAWFRQWAHDHAEAGLSPQTLDYQFPGVAGKNGRPKVFRLAARSASADLFCQAFLDAWAAKHGDRWAPYSPVIEEYEDRMARDSLERLRFEKQFGDKLRAAARRRRFDPVYGPGFNVDRRDWRDGSKA